MLDGHVLSPPQARGVTALLLAGSPLAQALDTLLCRITEAGLVRHESSAKVRRLRTVAWMHASARAIATFTALRYCI